MINSPWTLKVLKEFLPYHRKLYCIAYRLLENAADAEDLVQEAYLKLWDKREGLAIISNPEAFSVTLVKNMCFDLLRSGKYTLSRQSVELAEVHNMSQADNFEVRDEVQQVRHIIAHLPVQQQKIVTLRDVKGCSYEEIEQVTGLNATNVRVLLSRARKRYVRNLINGVTMKVEEIERLLAEFYEGNTNEQEEELLKEAFRTEEVPEHLQKDKKLFLSFFPGSGG